MNAFSPDPNPAIYAEQRKRSLRAATSSSSSARARTRRRRRKVNADSNTKKDESEAGIFLFGEKWLQDPNCVGSSVAALGQETPEQSGFSSQSTTRLPAEHQDSDAVTQGERRQGLTDSEMYIARLLHATRQQEGDDNVTAHSRSQQPAASPAPEWVWDTHYQRYRKWNGSEWVW